MDGLRLTTPLLKLLEALLASPAADHWGFELMRETGLTSGTTYPLLARLESMKWLESGWDEEAQTGPRRRFYRLTGDGAESARRALDEARARRPRATSTWKPVLGGAA